LGRQFSRSVYTRFEFQNTHARIRIRKVKNRNHKFIITIALINKEKLNNEKQKEEDTYDEGRIEIRRRT